MGTNPEEIRKIKILSGCVRFFFDLPFDIAQKFKEALKEKPLPPKLQELFETYNIDFRNTKFDIVEEAPYVKRLLLASDELRKDGRILTWMHLSDIHFQNKPGAMKWSQDKVKESFIKRLPDLLASWDLVPDMLFFTGDIAYSGEPEQYAVANDFLREIEQILGKDIRTYIVPGNHDVCWDKIDSLDARTRKSLTNQYEVSDLLLNSKNQSQKSKTFARFEHFSEFLKGNFSRNGTPVFQDEYFYVDQFDHLGLRLGVAGLNSAWLSTKKKKTAHDQDLGELLLGEPQVFQSIDFLKSAQIKFALLHHPPESMWFKDFDRRMQRAFLPKFDFILRGHEHEPTTHATTNILTDDEYIHFASGALYDATEMRGKTGYPISFNAVRLNLTVVKESSSIGVTSLNTTNGRETLSSMTDSRCSIFRRGYCAASKLNPTLTLLSILRGRQYPSHQTTKFLPKESEIYLFFRCVLAFLTRPPPPQSTGVGKITFLENKPPGVLGGGEGEKELSPIGFGFGWV